MQDWHMKQLHHLLPNVSSDVIVFVHMGPILFGPKASEAHGHEGANRVFLGCQQASQQVSRYHIRSRALSMPDWHKLIHRLQQGWSIIDLLEMGPFSSIMSPFNNKVTIVDADQLITHYLLHQHGGQIKHAPLYPP